MQVTVPNEGVTGWSDTWMVSATSKNKNCAYLWMNHIISPEANAAVAEYFGESPANAKACDKTADKNHCTTFHAGDEAYSEQDLVLDHPDRAVPRRPHRRQVHRLQQVDPGLDPDQGMTWQTLGTTAHRAPGVGPVRAGPRRDCWIAAADVVARGCVPGRAWRRCSSPRSGRRTGSPGRSSGVDARQLPDAVHRRRVPDDRAADVGVAVAGDRDRRGGRVPDRALHGEGGRAGVAAAAGGGADAVVGSYLVKAYAWRGMFSEGGRASTARRRSG